MEIQEVKKRIEELRNTPRNYGNPLYEELLSMIAIKYNLEQNPNYYYTKPSEFQCDPFKTHSPHNEFDIYFNE